MKISESMPYVIVHQLLQIQKRMFEKKLFQEPVSFVRETRLNRS